MTALGEVLAVFTDVAACDHHGHEYAIVTDGQRAHAWPLDPAAPTVDVPVSRTGVTLDVACTWKGCPGHVTFRLDTVDGWTGDADSRRLLTAYAVNVETDS